MHNNITYIYIYYIYYIIYNTYKYIYIYIYIYIDGYLIPKVLNLTTGCFNAKYFSYGICNLNDT